MMGTRIQFSAAGLVFCLIAACSSSLGSQSADLPDRIRSLASAGKLAEAMNTVELWVAAKPNDAEAMEWHARVLFWLGRWQESEREFRSLLRDHPESTDLLTALAAVLNARGIHEQALRELEHACPQPAGRPECGLARARTLMQLGRTTEASEIFRALLVVDAAAEESREALDKMREAGRYLVRVGGTESLSSYSGDGAGFGVAFAARWNTSWETRVEVAEYRRFGQAATGVQAGVTWRVNRRNAFWIGGGSAGAQDIVPVAQAAIGYNHGISIAERGPLRAVDMIYEQRCLWYRGFRIDTMSPAALVYLPKDWQILLQTTVTGLSAGHNGVPWTVSGQTRLTVPLTNRLRGNVFVSNGAENFGTVDQILFRSSKSVGLGLAVRASPGGELRAGSSYQRFGQGRSLLNFEAGYALRF
jgi:tetratricopeptide (TPR) repeat protein